MNVDISRVAAGVPAGGRYASRERSETDIALDALAENRDAYWVPGTIHSGGYDNVVTDATNGSTFYTLDGELHRVDGPAAILGDGTEEYYYEGALHRDDDQPAMVSSTGEREWRRYGELHRDGDLPARTGSDGEEEYFIAGRLSRAGGRPAVIRPDGRTEWWLNGVRHRPTEYGPALIEADGTETFYEHGKRVSRQKASA